MGSAAVGREALSDDAGLARRLPAHAAGEDETAAGECTTMDRARSGPIVSLSQTRTEMETLQEKIARVLSEQVAVVPYDPRWPEAFEQERKHLRSCLPAELLGRIEHFGSTAVPGLPAKPIVDILVEVRSLEETKQRIAPILEAQGYDYFWRPSWGADTPPFYAWFIKRDYSGRRTHHIHMVEANFEHWDRLLFRDYLRAFPEASRRYADLKLALARDHRDDRVAYTDQKGAFVRKITEEAREYYGTGQKERTEPTP